MCKKGAIVYGRKNIVGHEAVLYLYGAIDIGQFYPHKLKYLAAKEGGGFAIQIIVHYPETPGKQALFDARVAKLHAEYVAQYIEKLNCPIEQKLKLIDAIAQTVLDGCERDKSAK